MRMSALILLLPMAASSQASATHPDGVRLFVRKMLQTTHYERADADLNSDGRKESFVYVTDPGNCGSGGCVLVVLTPRGGSYRVVMRTTITRPPITILSTSAHGWRDVGVTVQGGGIVRPYMARLRFNGHRYPSNPTIPPAVPLGRTSGRVVIGG